MGCDTLGVVMATVIGGAAVAAVLGSVLLRRSGGGGVRVANGGEEGEGVARQLGGRFCIV